MRRRRENRLIQKIFPISGKFADRDNFGFYRLSTAAGSGKNHRFAFTQISRPPDSHRLKVCFLERLDQPKTGFLIVSGDMAGNGAAFRIDQPHLRRFDNQITDGQHQSTLADNDAVTAAVRAQRPGGKTVFGNFCPHRHHRCQGLIQIERYVRRFGPEFGGNFGGQLVHGQY